MSKDVYTAYQKKHNRRKRKKKQQQQFTQKDSQNSLVSQ